MKTARPNDVRIGANIRKLRVSRNMSQEELGKELALTFQQVQKYEKGTNRVSGSRIVMVAQALGVPINSLFEGIDLVNGKPPRRDPFHEFALVPGAVDFVEQVLRLEPGVQRNLLNACARIITVIAKEMD